MRGVIKPYSKAGGQQNYSVGDEGEHVIFRGQLHLLSERG
jgi:hypothetical protein